MTQSPLSQLAAELVRAADLEARRQGWSPGLSDEVFISFVVSGNDGGNPVHRANVVTLHGEQVFVEDYQEFPGPLPKEEISALGGDHALYLPLVIARWNPGQYARPPWCREELDGNCAPPVPEEAPVQYVDVDDPHRDVGRVR